MTTSNHKGFSLVEMLSVIAVIGIISAIAIPQIGRINDSSRDAVDKRNAQQLVSVFEAGSAAGANFYRTDYTLHQTIAQVRHGRLISGGVYDGSFFGLPGMTRDEVIRASQHIALTPEGKLIYSRHTATLEEVYDITAIAGGSGLIVSDWWENKGRDLSGSDDTNFNGPR